MAFDLSGLPAYVSDKQLDLIHKAIFTGRTISLIEAEGNVDRDIKSSENLHILDTDAFFQSGGVCGFTPSGTTTISNRVLTVGKFKINEELCPEDLEAKWTQMVLKPGSDYSTAPFPFEKAITDLKAAKIAKQLEVAVWQGNTASGNPNLNKFDGLIKLIDAASGVVTGNTGAVTAATGITVSNVRALVDGVWGAIPADVQGADDERIFVGWDVFTKYIQSYTAANLFHFSPDGKEVSAQNGTVVIPGTNYVLTAVHGLDATNRMFAIRMGNLHIGTDLLNEYEQFDMFYSKDDQIVKFVAKWKLGVQVAFPSEIVSFTLVP